MGQEEHNGAVPCQPCLTAPTEPECERGTRCHAQIAGHYGASRSWLGERPGLQAVAQQAGTAVPVQQQAVGAYQRLQCRVVPAARGCLTTTLGPGRHGVR